MSHWFHRNKLKGTIDQKFDGKGTALKPTATKMLTDLRTARQNLLTLFTDEVAKPEMVQEKANAYLELILGMADCDSEDNKLRYTFRFKWSDSLVMDGKPVVHQDCQFDVCSILMEVAIWLTKYGARVAAKSEITENDAKVVHKSFKQACGIFELIKTESAKLLDKAELGSDLDAHVIECYQIQCRAEAQEVTIARAVTLNHKPKLIAALAKDTKDFFEEADKQLAAIKNEPVVGKWRKYLQLKIEFYDSYLWCYHGNQLLLEEKCGEAVKCLTEAKNKFLLCGEICTKYRNTPGAGATVKPDEAIFFINYGKELKRSLEKADRENGFIFHQKIPDDLPVIELKATHGLAAPEPFSLPEISNRWNEELLAAFDLSNKSKVAEAKEKRKDTTEKVPDIKEPDVKVTKDNACSVM